MANVLVVPASGSIIFDSQTAGSSTISPLSTAPRISYDNAGGINIQSYVTATSALDRFTVDGTNGRLFSVSDALTGSIFSVNDISGLPIIEVNSGVTDVITMGTYGTNALVVSGGNVAIGTATPGSAKLTVVGNISTIGTTDLATFQSTTTQTPNIKIIGTDRNVTLTPAANGGNGTGLTGPSFYNAVRDSSSNSVRFQAVNSNGTVTYFQLWDDNATGVLAQRSGATPQEFRIYNTYTDAANYERGFFRWDTNTFKIGLSAGGTGVNRNLEFVAGGSTRMAIQSGGNVGIGTTTPSEKLHISGDNQKIKITNESATNDNLLVTSRGIFASRSSDGGYAASIIAIQNSNQRWEINSREGSVIRYDTGERLRVDSTAVAVVNVNFGIGTTTPNEKLTVSGNISASGTIYSAGSAVVVSPTIVSIQAVTSSQYSALVSAGQALSSVLYLVQDP